MYRIPKDWQEEKGERQEQGEGREEQGVMVVGEVQGPQGEAGNREGQEVLLGEREEQEEEVGREVACEVGQQQGQSEGHHLQQQQEQQQQQQEHGHQEQQQQHHLEGLGGEVGRELEQQQGQGDEHQQQQQEEEVDRMKEETLQGLVEPEGQQHQHQQHNHDRQQQQELADSDSDSDDEGGEDVGGGPGTVGGAARARAGAASARRLTFIGQRLVTRTRVNEGGEEGGAAGGERLEIEYLAGMLAWWPEGGRGGGAGGEGAGAAEEAGAAAGAVGGVEQGNQEGQGQEQQQQQDQLGQDQERGSSSSTAAAAAALAVDVAVQYDEQGPSVDAAAADADTSAASANYPELSEVPERAGVEVKGDKGWENGDGPGGHDVQQNASPAAAAPLCGATSLASSSSSSPSSAVDAATSNEATIDPTTVSFIVGPHDVPPQQHQELFSKQGEQQHQLQQPHQQQQQQEGEEEWHQQQEEGFHEQANQQQQGLQDWGEGSGEEQDLNNQLGHLQPQQQPQPQQQHLQQHIESQGEGGNGDADETSIWSKRALLHSILDELNDNDLDLHTSTVLSYLMALLLSARGQHSTPPPAAPPAAAAAGPPATTAAAAANATTPEVAAGVEGVEAAAAGLGAGITTAATAAAQRSSPSSSSSSSSLRCPLSLTLTRLELTLVDAKVLQLYTPTIHSCSNLKHITLLDLPYSRTLDDTLDNLVFSAPRFGRQLLSLVVSVLGVLSITCTPFFSLQHLEQLQVLDMQQHNMEVATALELRRLASRTALTALSRLGFRLIAAAPPADVTMPNLTKLTLTDASQWVKHGRTWELSSLFPNLAELTVLTAGSGVPGRDVSKLAVAVRGLTTLRGLTLGTKAGEGAFGGRESLLEIGRELPRLRRLTVACYGPMGLASTAVVLPDVSSFPQLEEFEYGAGPAAVVSVEVNAAAVLQWLSPLQQVRKVVIFRVPGLEVRELQSAVRGGCLPALQELAVDAGGVVHLLNVTTGDVRYFRYRDEF